jgi:hypothetical protein
MLNVTIQNDGKIKFQSECSDAKEMKFNVNLLLGVVQSMEIEEKANKGADGIPVQTTYYLYLNNVESNNRLSTARELSAQLNTSLERAKAIMDSSIDGKEIILSQSFDESYINNMKTALESVGCICKITQG